jgi:hypothetical protein
MTAVLMRHRRKRKGHGHGYQFFPPDSLYHGKARHARRHNTPPDPAQEARDEGATLPPATPPEPPDEEATNDHREATP